VSGLHGSAGGGEENGRDAEVDGVCRVDDVDATADRIKRLGGAVYVPPTDSNIGRISVVADPQTATLALVEGLTGGQRKQPPSRA
jgi:predicted enzyme related to lactoylglutathione lyase